MATCDDDRKVWNYFDPTVSDKARAHLSAYVNINAANAIADAIGQCVGRYRHAKGADWIKPADARAKADRVAHLLRELHGLTSTPDSLPAEFRAYLRDELRQHAVSWPDNLPKLIVLAERAANRMPAPVKGAQPGIDMRDDAIRAAFNAIREEVPTMGKQDARVLASEVVGKVLGLKKTPSDPKELAKITREK